MRMDEFIGYVGDGTTYTGHGWARITLMDHRFVSCELMLCTLTLAIAAVILSGLTNLRPSSMDISGESTFGLGSDGCNLL